MIIKKFIAPTMPEALARVKKELGEEAVILKTRMNRKGSNDAGKSVEITAAVEKNGKPHFESLVPEPVTIPAGDRLAGLRTEKDPEVYRLPSEKLDELIEELAEFRNSFKKDSEAKPVESFFGNFSASMLAAGRELIARNLAENLAYGVISELAKSDNAMSLDKIEIKARIYRTLCSMIPAAEPVAIMEKGPTVVMVVGMAGSGKTSAVARLATRFRVENNEKVAIITTDNFRADTSQQIKSFCRILGCPCGIVYSPEELSMAIRSQTEGLIFVDTTGVNPGNDKEIGELHSFIRAAKPHEIHLVAAASTPARDIRRLIDVFGESGIDKILITKLDETEAAGGVITAAIESGKQLSYISCSREIPGRFGLASPESLAETLTSEKPLEPAQSGWEMEAVGIWQ